MWSPEHLYVAAVAACLMTTFRAIAESSNLEVLEYRDDSVGTLVKGEDRYLSMVRVVLRPTVVISDPTKIDKAVRILRKAEEACLISRSVKSDVVLEPCVLVPHQVGT